MVWSKILLDKIVGINYHHHDLHDDSFIRRSILHAPSPTPLVKQPLRDPTISINKDLKSPRLFAAFISADG